MVKFLQTHMIADDFKDLKIPFVAVATDLRTGAVFPVEGGAVAPPSRLSRAAALLRLRRQGGALESGRGGGDQGAAAHTGAARRETDQVSGAARLKGVAANGKDLERVINLSCRDESEWRNL